MTYEKYEYGVGQTLEDLREYLTDRSSPLANFIKALDVAIEHLPAEIRYNTYFENQYVVKPQEEDGEKPFKCPDCGGYKWGTSGCTAPKSKWHGHCHGDDYHGGCGFMWHRATDDVKHLGVPLGTDDSDD